MDGRRNSLVSQAPHRSTNLSLWLERFVGTQKPGPGGDKATELASFQKRWVAALDIRVDEGYKAALRRREDALGQLDGGFRGGVTRLFTARTLGRLAVGLGQASVWENNISLLPTWGTPVIPGSALKGLASSYAAQNGDAQWARTAAEDTVKGELQSVLFGDSKRAGEVTFHDAWWISPDGDGPLLDRDVMTVHHPDYYAEIATAPADWDEPNPVGFFTASGEFLIALSGPPAAVAVATELLRCALKDVGVGAKTSAGYGRMDLPLSDEEVEALAQAKALQQKAASADRRFEALVAAMPHDKAASELATRFQNLFGDNSEYSETQKREVVERLAQTNKQALVGWQKKNPARPGAALVRAVLDELAAQSAPPPRDDRRPATVPETIRVQTIATVRVKGKDVLIESLDDVPCKPNQKAAAIAGKSPQPEKQKAYVHSLRESGGATRVPVVVVMRAEKIATIDFMDAGATSSGEC